MSKVKVAVVVGKRRCVARRLSIFAASFAGFLAAVSVAVLGIAHLADALMGSTPETISPEEGNALVASATPASAVLNDDWLERITRDSSWRAGRTSTPSTPSSRRKPPSRLQGPPVAPAPAPTPWFFADPAPSSAWWADEPQRAARPAPKKPRVAAGYRTVCVRLCDGSFFPVGYGASESSFSRAQATCSNTCPGSRLYYYRPASQDADEMVDVNGQPYSKLKSANLFRTQYVASCKCKPHPWEQASVDRHHIYTLEDQRRRGNRSVVAELEQMKARNRIVARAANRQNEYSRGQRRRAPAVVEVAGAPPPSPPEQNVPPRSDASRGQGGGVMSGSIVAAASAATVQSVTADTQRTVDRPPNSAARPTISPARSLSVAGQSQTDLSELVPKSPIAGLPLTVEPARPAASPLADLPLTAPAPALAPLPGQGVEPAILADPPAVAPRKSRRSSKVERKRTQANAAKPRPSPAPRRTAEWTRGVFAPF